MTKYGKRILADLPQQFKGKERIEALVDAIGKQLDQVQLFYNDLNVERSIQSAKGDQLDRIGEIVVLSRKEASKILKKNKIIGDDLYRLMLINKVSINFGNATYPEIMNCIKTLQKGILGFRYKEDPKIPATIILECDESHDITNVEKMLETPIPKAAGVGLLFKMQIEEESTVYCGLAIRRSDRPTIECNEAQLPSYEFLANEDEEVFVDETGAWIIE